jgi:hypothetical protein
LNDIDIHKNNKMKYSIGSSTRESEPKIISGSLSEYYGGSTGTLSDCCCHGLCVLRSQSSVHTLLQEARTGVLRV